MTPEQEINRARQAAEVLENEAFQAAFQQIEQEIVEQWKNAPARDTDGRERLWTMLQLLQKVKQTLEASMQAGHLAAQNLKHHKTMLERLRSG